MPENVGWISIYRQIQNHWIWKDANKFKWWIDILLTVNNSEAKVNIGMDIFDCKRGQSLLSIQSWASRWNVSKDTARNFLKLLEKDNMIVLENMKKTTRITVCKYDDYQSSLHDCRTTSKRASYDSRTPSDPNNNDYNKDNEIGSNAMAEIFERWLKYKKDRKESYKTIDSKKTAFKKLINLSNGDLIIADKIIDSAIGNNYSGFFELKENNKSFGKTQPTINFEQVAAN